jgi:hypothetical protein
MVDRVPKQMRKTSERWQFEGWLSWEWKWVCSLIDFIDVRSAMRAAGF